MAKFFRLTTCKACGGDSDQRPGASVTLNGKNIGELSSMELTELREFLEGVTGPVAEPILAPIRWRMDQLIDIGAGYLSLDRPVGTLSGGESQRVKMAKQLTCDLVGLTYVFDEPSIGMHPRDMHRVVEMLRRLRDRGNSVLVVEHDPDVIACADYVIDIGPGAGTQGGQVLFCGSVEGLKRADTATGRMFQARFRRHLIHHQHPPLPQINPPCGLHRNIPMLLGIPGYLFLPEQSQCAYQLGSGLPRLDNVFDIELTGGSADKRIAIPLLIKCDQLLA